MAVLKQIHCTITLTSLDPKTGAKLTDTIASGVNLISVQAQNGEGERSNSCSFEFSDPDLKIAAKYRERSLSVGGIRVPANLLEKDESKGDSSGNGSGNGTGKAPDIQGNPKGDDLYRLIIQYCRSVGVTDLGQIAYILATAQHEAAGGQYYEEIASGAEYEGRSDLGNTQSGDGVKFKGRGLVQITGRTNYSRWSKFLGVDAIANPALFAQGKYAIAILVLGMTGKNNAPNFTGYTLGEFVNGSKRNFVNARRVVNGLDRANLIAGYAQEWLGKIPSLSNPSSSSTGSNTKQFAPAGLIPKDSKDPIADAISAVAKQRGAVDVIPPDCVEISIALSTNYNDQVVSYNFYLIGVSSSTDLPNRTTIQGRSLRYLIGNMRDRATFKNISLRQVAERIGAKIGADVVIPNKAASEKIYTSIAQNGETDYQFLLRLAQAQGFTIKEEPAKDGNPPKLTLIEASSGTILKADRSWGSTLTTSDEADSKRIFSEATINALSKAIDKTSASALPPISSLADGEKIGTGYETELAIPNPTIAQLAIQPGSIIEIQPDLAPRPIARDYRVKASAWKWERGRIAQKLLLYIPVNIKVDAKEKPDGPTGMQNGASSTTPSITSANWNDNSDRISKYFTVGDSTKNGQRIPTTDTVKQNIFKLAAELDRVVEAWAKRNQVAPARGQITINSWYRDPATNAAIGGARNSQHLYGSAADVVNQIGGSLTGFQTWLDTFWGEKALGYGAVKGFVHLDLRSPGRIRWDY